MTSNMGAESIQVHFEKATNENRLLIAEKAKLDVMSTLKKMVRPEFLNRIDEIIMFTPLNKKEIKEIVQIHLKKLSKMLSEKQIILYNTEEAIDDLAEKGFDPQFGARPVKRVIQKEVLNALSKEILAGRILPEQQILLDSFDGKFVFRNS